MTPPSNKGTLSLADLRQRLLDLPAKRERSSRLDNVRQFVSKLRQQDEKLRQTLRGRRYAPVVFEPIALAKVDDHVRQAARHARTLHKRLAQDPARVSDDSSSKRVADIGALSQSAEKALADQWAAQVNAVVTRYGKLVAALGKLNMSDAGSLEQSLKRLGESAVRPPLEAEKAARMRADVDALVESIARLGLTGVVGQFLMQAADRTAGADPRELFAKPEIKAFLDKHDLWAMLALQFRN